MQRFTPYLNFAGTTEAAMKFYQSVFGTKPPELHRFKDTPGGEKMPPADQEKIIHASLDIGNGMVIMATDTTESMQPLVMGNNFHICLHADSEAETEKVFDGISKGGKVEMPLNKTFWGAYFGMCRDKFGVQWMISYDYNRK